MVTYFHPQSGTVPLKVCKRRVLFNDLKQSNHKKMYLSFIFRCIVFYLYAYSFIRKPSIQTIHDFQKSGEANWILNRTRYNKGKQYFTIKSTLKVKNMRLLAPKLLEKVYFYFLKQAWTLQKYLTIRNISHSLAHGLYIVWLMLVIIFLIIHYQLLMFSIFYNSDIYLLIHTYILRENHKSNYFKFVI